MCVGCVWGVPDLLQVPGGVDVGLDLALLVQVQDGVHGGGDELRLALQVAQVEAAHRLVALDEAERVDGELMVPVLGHSDEVLLLACQHVGSTWWRSRERGGTGLNFKCVSFPTIDLYFGQLTHHFHPIDN